MNLEIIGKVVQLGQRQTGDGRNGPWVKQELIIETEDQYPKKICLMCWSKQADEAASFVPGDKIKASINIESREFNGKWFTDVKVWRFDKPGSGTNMAQTGANVSHHDLSGIQPSNESYQNLPTVEDDLPF